MLVSRSMNIQWNFYCVFICINYNIEEKGLSMTGANKENEKIKYSNVILFEITFLFAIIKYVFAIGSDASAGLWKQDGIGRW